MFTQISWSIYVTTILILSVAYYLLVAFRYYRKDIVKIFAVKKLPMVKIFQWIFKNPFFNHFQLKYLHFFLRLQKII